jgi:hypothetical protein
VGLVITSTTLLAGCGRFQEKKNNSTFTPVEVVRSPGDALPLPDHEYGGWPPAEIPSVLPISMHPIIPKPALQKVRVEVLYAPGTIQEASITVLQAPYGTSQDGHGPFPEPQTNSTTPTPVATTFTKDAAILPELRLKAADGSFDLWWRVVYTAEIPFQRGSTHVLVTTNSRTFKEALVREPSYDRKPSDSLTVSIAVTPENLVLMDLAKEYYPVKDGDILEVTSQTKEARVVGKNVAFKEIEVLTMNDKGQLVSASGVVAPDLGSKVLITRYTERDPFTENTLSGTPCSVTKTLVTCSTRLIYGNKVP